MKEVRKQLFEDLQNLSSAINHKEEAENPINNLVGKYVKLIYSDGEYEYALVKGVNPKNGEGIADLISFNRKYNEYRAVSDEEIYLDPKALTVITEEEFNEALNDFKEQINSIFKSMN